MPRIYNSANDPLDFCQHCFPDRETAEVEHGDVTISGTGPDERGNCFEYEAEHPPYEDTDYTCEACRDLLAERDN